jgi:hypothetical protein
MNARINAGTNPFLFNVPPPFRRDAALQVKGQRKKVKGPNRQLRRFILFLYAPLYPFTFYLYPIRFVLEPAA